MTSRSSLPGRTGKTMRSYGPKKRTKADKRTSLFVMLTMRRSLDGITVDGLVRSYGVDAAEAIQMLENEQARRAA